MDTDITPCLWFDGNAEEAAHFYTSVVPDSSIGAISRYGAHQPMPEGTALTVDFDLAGRPFTALNGGPQFPFTEAVSLQVRCTDQAEVDAFWTALVEGGESGPCGWLKDRFGFSWQIVPTALLRLQADPDPGRVDRVMAAMMATRGKFDVAALERAASGG